jgi:DnaJ domain
MYDPWTALGVSPNVSEKELRAAFRVLALRWHPDRNGGCKEAATRFKEASAAYEAIVSNSSRPVLSSDSNRWASNHESRTAGSARSGRIHRQAWSSGFRAADFNRGRAQGVHAHPWRFWKSLSPTSGVALGVFCVVVAFGCAAGAADAVWRFSNRGKSFEEVQRRIHKVDGPNKK